MENKLSRRDAIKLLTLGGGLLFSGRAEAKPTLSAPTTKKKINIVIVGAGSAGMMSAARLRRSAPNAKITIIAPNETHLYQPGQTFVAAGLYKQSENERQTATLLPERVEWIKESVALFEPEKNSLKTDRNRVVKYDYLVVALGAEYNYESIDGLSADIIGKNGLASVYLNNTLKGNARGGEITKEWFEDIYNSAQSKKIKVLCIEPEGAIKGLGTGLDILFLANDIVRGKTDFGLSNLQKNVEFSFITAKKSIFPFDKFAKVLQKELDKRGVSTILESKLKAIDADKKVAIFESKNGEIKKEYDFLHISLPIEAPKVLRESPLAYKDGKYKGFLEVNKKTLQHKKYKNVFGAGDVLGIPLAKTGGSAQHQAIILQDNIASLADGRGLPMSYNGYTVAPIKTEFGKVLLAEFNEKKALPTFWLNPYKPRWIWWEMDLHILRYAYFSLMMRGMM